MAWCKFGNETYQQLILICLIGQLMWKLSKLISFGNEMNCGMGYYDVNDGNSQNKAFLSIFLATKLFDSTNFKY